MTYKRELARIFEHRLRARNEQAVGTPVTFLRSFLRALYPSLPLLALAPLLVSFRLTGADPATVEWPLAEFAEPSGIVYHPGRKSLFVVGDEGDIGEISLEGVLLRQVHLGGDLEGITVDPSSGLLYVAREGHEVILEVRPDDFKMLRRFTIDRTFDGDPNFLQRGGDGIEGVAFVPAESAGEPGRLFVVNQYDPAALIELEAPLAPSKEKFAVAKIVAAHRLDGAPLSDLTWDPARREFLVVSALWKQVYAIDEHGVRRRSERIPGFMPEGLARLPDGRIAIAQDSGGVVIWTPSVAPLPADGAQGEPLPPPAAPPPATEQP